jgi:gamma-glutamyl phosphate reductase
MRTGKSIREVASLNIQSSPTPVKNVVAVIQDNMDVKGKNIYSANEEDDNLSKAMSESYEDELVLNEVPIDPIEARLQQITELLMSDRKKRSKETSRGLEKRQVVFVLANYFVLFLSLIAISAEIQARAPDWLNSLEKQLQNVHDCAADKEALFECVTNGDFAGLVASVIIWLTRSVATRRIFLFGFETQKKLWTVVYESRKFFLSPRR